MAKVNKEQQWRAEGMAYALKIAKEKGIDGLEEEIKFRNATHIPIQVSRPSCEDAINRIKENTIDTMLIMSIASLVDTFNFGEFQCRKFMNEFDKKTDMLQSFQEWENIIKEIKDRTDIELEIRENK